VFRLTKRADPSSPPANTARVYYDSAGTGYNTPVSLAAIDESGNLAMLAHFGVLDYRLLKVTVVTASGGGTWTPQAGCRAAYVELVGGGGQGGGCATSSGSCSVGGGGGGGAYAASWITGVSATVAYVVGTGGSGGAAGSSGVVGNDTTWAVSVIVAKGGSGGAALAAGTSVLVQAGGLGGAAASCTGDLKISGSQGGKGTRDSAAIGFSGDGGPAAYIGSVGAVGTGVVAGGTAGPAALATAYGSGGAGAATTTTQQAGGVGAAGLIRIWEFA
jgi:hypothetical protein